NGLSGIIEREQHALFTAQDLQGRRGAGATFVLGQLTVSPPGAGPDRALGVAGLELHPDTGADGRNCVKSLAVARIGDRRQGPARFDIAEHFLDLRAQPAESLRIVVVGDEAAVLAIMRLRGSGSWGVS